MTNDERKRSQRDVSSFILHPSTFPFRLSLTPDLRPPTSPMSDTTQLQTIRSQTLQQLADLRANPKPSYELDGQRVDWESYVQSLEQTLDWCDRKLNAYAPFEIRSEAGT